MFLRVVSFSFSVLTTLFLVVDAPAAVPLFLSMTATDSRGVQKSSRRAYFLAADAELGSNGV